MTQVRPMRADARRNYERLLKAAAEAFAEHGEGASLDDIAKRAGVGSGTLYRHFPTRQDLLEAAYVDRIDAIAARADEIAAQLPPGQALVEWLRELSEGMIQVRGLKSLLGSAVTDGSSYVVTACGKSVKGAAERLVTAAQREGTLRPDLEPVEVLRLAHGVATASELADGGGRYISRYLSLLTEGLWAPGRRPDAHGEAARGADATAPRPPASPSP
ncbi:TetR/AcrR family transcriptional regulator [Streptomyces sp. NPDC090306]|uniref:TetR/AcrR family transcriptional regulator n=1 Tax=Streptomyces sp. NPDC090306 TaxID=3365961 RepID=UPI00381E44EE